MLMTTTKILKIEEKNKTLSDGDALMLVLTRCFAHCCVDYDADVP